MSDPTRLSEQQQAKSTLNAQTEEINRLERLLAQHGQAANSVAEVEEPAAPGERLFSRKTLFGWAFATLLVVFVIRMIVPEVVKTVKHEIVSRMEEPSSNSAAPVVAPAPPTTVTPATPATTTGETVIKVEVKKR